MQMNSMRKEILEVVSGILSARKPALRRCAEEDWLYMTDLPGLCEEEETEKIIIRFSAAGWETKPVSGWLLLRKPAEVPPKDWYQGLFGPEAECCRSLLSRHCGRGNGKEEVQRMLIKAGEGGEKAYETACASLHRAWAEKLRKKELLPGINQAYFGK